jgi:hypothetical protein
VNSAKNTCQREARPLLTSPTKCWDRELSFALVVAVTASARELASLCQGWDRFLSFDGCPPVSLSRLLAPAAHCAASTSHASSALPGPSTSSPHEYRSMQRKSQRTLDGILLPSRFALWDRRRGSTSKMIVAHAHGNASPFSGGEEGDLRSKSALIRGESMGGRG